MPIRTNDTGIKYRQVPTSRTSLPVLGIHLEGRPVLYCKAVRIELGMQVDELQILPK